jgi:hypothetical protein
MSSYYPEPSMRGSGIDSGEFDYGHFTCNNCAKDNSYAIAYYDDWGNWTVECKSCEETHDKGHTYDRED